MGGRGSGRRYHLDAKRTAESCLFLDINWLHRNGLLRKGLRFPVSWTSSSSGQRSSIEVITHDGRLELLYAVNGVLTREMVYLTSTACNYGNRRPWFECPQCDRRVGKLYSVDGVFRCRKCHDLAYASSQEAGTSLDKEIRKVERLRRKLGAVGNEVAVLNRFNPAKPKGMHWETYWRLRLELNQAEQVAFGGMMNQLESFRTQ